MKTPIVIRSLKPHEWPKADQAAWAEACRPGGRLTRGGRASHLKPVTCNDLARRYGQFLDHVARTAGLDLKSQAAAAVTPDRVAAYAAELKARVDEAILLSFLSGTDRRAFETLYALDAKRLREGGDQMLKAQSDVGQTLFTAASGLVALSRVREELKQQLDEIGSLHRAREKPIWRAEQAYQFATKQTQELALRVDQWNTADQVLSAAVDRLGSLSGERGALEAIRGVHSCVGLLNHYRLFIV